LDGGLAKWQRENRPLNSGMETAPATTHLYPAQFNPALFVSADQVLAIINDPAWRLIDARAAERFSGATEPIDPIAGHIPSALNRFHGLNLTPEGIFKPAAQLREEFSALLNGAAADHAIVYCGSGVTSCHHLIALELANLPGALIYLGSWSEWIRDPARPIVTP
jgi:thiosulfate/3-mercaptopyruvate sulfurtransferase